MKQKINYGLTCISEILKDKDKKLAYQTMTRKRFLELGKTEALKQLSKRILHNMEFASVVVKHCHDIGIKHYRIPSAFPLMTDQTLNLKFSDLPDEEKIYDAMAKIGETAKKYDIRLGSHPDQFVILCSYNDAVCNKSIIELNLVGWFFDKMGLEQSHRYPINIHTTIQPEKGNSVFDVYNKLYRNLMKCDIGVQKRFVIENEDKGIHSCESLLLCNEYLNRMYNFNLPCTFDNLHNQCNPSLTDKPQEFWIEEFKKTWKGFAPVFHWSEGGLNGNKRSHVDFITENVGQPKDNSVYWELEVKAKDKAILKLLNG